MDAPRREDHSDGRNEGHNGTNGPNGVRRIDSGGKVDLIVREVHGACKTIDAACSVTYVGLDECERTVVRIRAGSSASVGALQRALARRMPFARVRASENVLDGSLQAQITLPTRHDETRLARASVARRAPVRALRALAIACACIAILSYVGQIASGATLADGPRAHAPPIATRAVPDDI
jgi:hypothetical protein